MSDTWNYLLEEVINPGLCTQCGSCVGLAQGKLEFKEKRATPTPSSQQMITNYHKLVDSLAQQGIVRTQISIKAPLENSLTIGYREELLNRELASPNLKIFAEGLLLVVL